MPTEDASCCEARFILCRWADAVCAVACSQQAVYAPTSHRFFLLIQLIAFSDRRLLFPISHDISEQLNAFSNNSQAFSDSSLIFPTTHCISDSLLYIGGRARCVSRRIISCVATFCCSGFSWQALFCTGSLGRARRFWRRRWPIRPARPSCV